jgi:HEAT repeat protein
MNRESALRTLSDGDPPSRRVAVRALGQWNDPETLHAIVGALNDHSRDVQEAASDTLLEVGDSRAVELLVPMLRSDSPSGRNFARLVLERLGKADPQLIINLSHDADPRMRIFCANILGGMSDHDFAPALHHLLKDSDVNVRDASIVALGRLGAVESVPRLAPFLATEEPWVRFSAIDALSKIPGPDAAAALLASLPTMEPELREAVVDAIGQQASPSSVEPLVELIGRYPELKRAILRVLTGPLKSAVLARPPGPSTERLAAALARELDRAALDDRWTAQVLEVLGSIGGAAEAPAVLKALRTGLPKVVSAAIPVLLRLQPGLDRNLAAEIRESLSVLNAARKERS